MGRTGKHNRNNLRCLFFLVATVLFSACSVKEDRILCPCILEMEFAESDPAIVRSVELQVTSRNGFRYADTVSVAESGNRYSVPVPRTDLHIRAWAGTDGMASEYGLLIPLGRACPEVYMHDSDVCAEGETVHDVIFMRKNYCAVTLITKGGVRLPSDVRVKGNVAGYDDKGQPVRGRFEVFLDDDSEAGVYEFVLPRQIDSSLVMEVEDGQGGYKAFALGHYIASSGYDWNAADLEDVTVVIDYALTEIRLTISGWDGTYSYEMEI